MGVIEEAKIIDSSKVDEKVVEDVVEEGELGEVTGSNDVPIDETTVDVDTSIEKEGENKLWLPMQSNNAVEQVV